MIYPKKCPICHKILGDPEKWICSECVSALIFVGKYYCMKCGKPVKEGEMYCEQCTSRKMSFTQGRSVLIYNDALKKSIVKFKYENRREYGDFYAWLMCRYAEKQILYWKPDVIFPVPLHKRKQRTRGFNQAEYLARQIGKEFGIPVTETALKKVRDTRSQKKLNAEERRKNLENAFEVCEDVNGLNILVIDDVYTTGSTMNEIASVLTMKGAKKVFFLTFCTGYN